jgi:hypothetical protein
MEGGLLFLIYADVALIRFILSVPMSGLLKLLLRIKKSSLVKNMRLLDDPVGWHNIA